MTYTRLDRLVEAVFNTGIHQSEDADAEFALAVYVQPYPNNVFSVWVYVATLSAM